ncbi:MAG: hypothetical protein EBZ84_07815, partial [Betaproteobacteria bacterium]|nr:hypothetical protein [Betaproteobacteria bacterium]
SIADTHFLFISKSGGTAETLSQALLLLSAIETVNGAEAIARQCHAIVEPGTSALRQLSERYHIPVLDHDPGVGGRFSVLSCVGLLPAAVGGLDIASIRKGAAKALDQAQSILRSIREGKDFAQLARQFSKDSGSAAQGGDLGFFGRDAMVKAFADAVFALKAGELSEPVVSEFGVHIIKLTEIRVAKLKAFERVRGDIELQLKQETAQKRFAELAESFSNTVYEQSDSLEPAALKISRPVIALKSLRADGRLQTAAGEPGEKAAIHPRVLAAVFSDESIRLRRNSDAIEVAPGVMVSARLRSYEPPKSPPLEAVRTAVAEAWKDQAAMARARTEGERWIETLRKQLVELDAAKPSDPAILKNPLLGTLFQGFSDPIVVSRGQPTVLDQDSLRAVFKLGFDAKQRVSGVTVADQGFRVLVLESVLPHDEAQIKSAVPVVREQLASLEGRLLSDQYLKYLRAKSDVKTFPARIAPAANKP